jgi:hypothetical protein
MPPRIPENALVIPALECLYDSPNGRASTTRLRRYLEEAFAPEGEDVEILKGRSDMKFDQKVRNLKSHETLLKSGYATHYRGGFEITPAGRRLIEKIRAKP